MVATGWAVGAASEVREVGEPCVGEASLEHATIARSVPANPRSGRTALDSNSYMLIPEIPKNQTSCNCDATTVAAARLRAAMVSAVAAYGAGSSQPRECACELQMSGRPAVERVCDEFEVTDGE